MPGRVDLEGLRALLARGAQLVEVLPVAEYTDEHPAGRGQPPAQGTGRHHRRGPAGPVAPGGPLLLGRPVRHEPTSRVPA